MKIKPITPIQNNWHPTSEKKLRLLPKVKKKTTFLDINKPNRANQDLADLITFGSCMTKLDIKV